MRAAFQALCVPLEGLRETKSRGHQGPRVSETWLWICFSLFRLISSVVNDGQLWCHSLYPYRMAGEATAASTELPCGLPAVCWAAVPTPSRGAPAPTPSALRPLPTSGGQAVGGGAAAPLPSRRPASGDLTSGPQVAAPGTPCLRPRLPRAEASAPSGAWRPGHLPARELVVHGGSVSARCLGDPVPCPQTGGRAGSREPAWQNASAALSRKEFLSFTPPPSRIPWW